MAPVTINTTTEAERVELRGVLLTLRSVVNEQGHDFTYQRHEGACLYIHDGNPDCLIGRVLHRLGFSLKDLSSWEGRGVYLMSPMYKNTFRDEGQVFPGLSDKSIFVLHTAQTFQDDGRTWGAALSAALAEADVNYGVKL